MDLLKLKRNVSRITLQIIDNVKHKLYYNYKKPKELFIDLKYGGDWYGYSTYTSKN